MKNSKLRRALLLVASAVLLVCVSVGATLAYLTDDTEVVENTFTVGHIYIHLDESNADATLTDVITDCGNPGNHSNRDRKNTYHLVPDATIDKDPAVWVEEESEKMFLFIEVFNALAEIEQETTDVKTINQQILTNGWSILSGAIVPNNTTIYYRVFDPDDAASEPEIILQGTEYKIPTFTKVHISDTLDNTGIADYANKTITVKAYAIQYEGMNDNADEAWTALNNQMPNP